MQGLPEPRGSPVANEEPDNQRSDHNEGIGNSNEDSRGPVR